MIKSTALVFRFRAFHLYLRSWSNLELVLRRTILPRDDSWHLPPYISVAAMREPACLLYVFRPRAPRLRALCVRAAALARAHYMQPVHRHARTVALSLPPRVQNRTELFSVHALDDVGNKLTLSAAARPQAIHGPRLNKPTSIYNRSAPSAWRNFLLRTLPVRRPCWESQEKNIPMVVAWGSVSLSWVQRTLAAVTAFYSTRK